MLEACDRNGIRRRGKANVFCGIVGVSFENGGNDDRMFL
jgi:hypothetical protein